MLFPYLIKVSFLLAILTLGYRWLVQFETFSKVNRLLLLFNLVAAWTLPLLPLPYWGPVKVQQQFHETVPVFTQKIPQITKNNVFSAPIQSAPVTPTTALSWSIFDSLFAIYLAGVLILTSLLLIRVFSLIHRLRKLPSEKTRDFTLIYDLDLASPYSFFKWVILNSAAHTQEQLQHILAHEGEHARNWHSIDLLAVEMQKILLWFNPFAWYHCRLVQENLEFLADRAVLTIGFEKKPYQLNLLKIALNDTSLPLTNSFAQSILKKRIKMMNRKPSALWVIGKYILLLAVIYVSSAFVAPYKRQLIEVAPSAIKPAVDALVPESLPQESPKPKNKVTKKSKQVEPKTTAQETSNPITKKNPTTIYRNDTLYWVISPMASWDDITSVKDEVKKMGAELSVNNIRFDSKQQFISTLVLNFKSIRGTGRSGQTHDSDSDEPMYGTAGYVTKDDLSSGFVTHQPEGDINFGTTPPELVNTLKNDYQQALNLYKESVDFYFVNRLEAKLKENKVRFGTTIYSKDLLEKENISQALRHGIHRNKDNTIYFSSAPQNSSFYINSEPSSHEEVSKLKASQIKQIKIIADYDNLKDHIIITTK